MAASDMRSSPARTTMHCRPVDLSSSPLPDIKDLGAKKPKPQTLRGGSAAAPIPASASSTFARASDLLRSAHADGDDFLDAIHEPEPPIAKKAPAKRARKTAKEPKAKRAPKRVAKEVIILSSDGVTPRIVRHGDAEAEEQAEEAVGGKGAEGTAVKTKPRKNYKAPADLEQAGPGEDQPGLAKPAAEAKTRKTRKKAETVSKHFSRESSVAEKPVTTEKRPRISTPEPINLEPAVQRRRDWTPPRPDTTFSEPNPFDTPMATSTLADEGTGTKPADLFKTLRDTYGHKAAVAALPAAPQQYTMGVLGKRKAIEMVAVHQSLKPAEPSLEPPPVKEKAPKKKPRTITELAMAAYAPQVESVEELPREDSLLEYFSVGGGEREESSKNAAGKGKGKATKAANSKKKVPAKKPVLLSPQSAMRQSARQDFVFGTSSQLAREQSPTFLRDLHEAMKASTIMEEDSSFASPPVGERLKLKQPGKGLWSVSARDEDGEMVNVDVIDLVNSPAFPEDDAILNPWKQLSLDPVGTGTETTDSSLIELESRPLPISEDDFLQPPIPKSHFFTSQRKITINSIAAASPQHSNSSHPLVTDLLEEDEMPPPSNQQQTLEEVRETPSTAMASVQNQRPNYELFTDAKLAKEISRYGFKAVKARSGMISLLDMCWKSINQGPSAGAAFSTSALAAIPKRKEAASSTTTSTASLAAKKPRGRAKKVTETEVSEQTSEDAVVSLPAKKPRGRAKKVADAEISEQDAVVSSPAKKPRGRAKKVVETGVSEQTSVAEAVVVSSKRKRSRTRKEAVGGKEAVGAKKAAASVPQPGPSTPNRRKRAVRSGRARSNSDVDSEVDTSFSSSKKLFSATGASFSDDTEVSLNLSPSAQQSTLFRHITEAVTSAPRTKDPANPSWHEKMLMYDPVVLEDLTAWLNSGQLTRVGHDDEVAPEDVKKWCESRSICCFWRIKVRGRKRKRA